MKYPVISDFTLISSHALKLYGYHGSVVTYSSSWLYTEGSLHTWHLEAVVSLKTGLASS